MRRILTSAISIVILTTLLHAPSAASTPRLGATTIITTDGSAVFEVRLDSTATIGTGAAAIDVSGGGFVQIVLQRILPSGSSQPELVLFHLPSGGAWGPADESKEFGLAWEDKELPRGRYLVQVESSGGPTEITLHLDGPRGTTKISASSGMPSAITRDLTERYATTAPATSYFSAGDTEESTGGTMVVAMAIKGDPALAGRLQLCAWEGTAPFPEGPESIIGYGPECISPDQGSSGQLTITDLGMVTRGPHTVWAVAFTFGGLVYRSGSPWTLAVNHQVAGSVVASAGAGAWVNFSSTTGSSSEQTESRAPLQI